MSVKIKKTVVATDCSENSKNAVEWGIAMAKVNNAVLTAVYVIPSSDATLLCVVKCEPKVLGITCVKKVIKLSNTLKMQQIRKVSKQVQNHKG